MILGLTFQQIADGALVLLALIMVVFTATYTLGSPWWTTRLGQIYAVKSVLLTLVLMQNSLTVLTNQEYPGRHPLRMLIYVGGAIAMLALYFVLRRYQREGKRVRAAAGDTRSRFRVWKDVIREWANRP